MNAAEALEHASALFIPEFLYASGLDAMNAERTRNEEAIVALVEEYFAKDDPGFEFGVVLELADRNRDLCDRIGIDSLENVRSLSLARSLTDADLVEGVARLQRRTSKGVERDMKGDIAGLALAMQKKQMKGTVVGIDLETTGTSPDRCYIINVGWALMDLTATAESTGQQEIFCGLPQLYAEKGVPLERVHHITWDMVDGAVPFRENADLQARLLAALTAHPFLAHNAAFEDSWLLLNLPGYAEARKAGKIMPIDTRDICRRLDFEVAKLPFSSKPASLESWARRRGVLAPDEVERHLALADVELMLRTLQAELNLKELLPAE